MDTKPTNKVAALRMTAAMILSGSIGVLVVESGLGSATVVFWRCVLGAIAIAAYAVITGRVAPPMITPRASGLMAFSGVTMAANWVFFFRAYEHAPISTVTIVYHLYPFVLLLAAGLFFGEPIRRRSLGWAAVAFAGVVVIAQGAGEGAMMDLTGIGLTVIAMSFYSATLMIAKRLQGISPELTSAVQLIVGAVVLLPFQTFSEIEFDARIWGILLTLGIVHTGLLYVLLYGAVQKLDTASVALLSFLYPATALGFDIAVYGMRPGPVQIAGIAMILLAVLAERTGLGVLGRFSHLKPSKSAKPKSER